MNSNFGKLISNYAAKFWGLISVFIFIPIYIKFLGIENYGVISFNALLLGIISFADAGMSSAIVKEFSKDVSAVFKYSLFREIEKLYIVVCLIVCLVIYLCSDVIANHWLKTNVINLKLLSYYVSLIAVGVTLQLITSLYFGALFGLNSQVRANTYQTIWNVFRSGVVIFGFLIFKPTLEVYFLWQIVCTFIYILVLRFSITTKLKYGGIELKNVLNGIPKNVKSYIGGMTLIAIISALNSQADKIITSSFFSLKIFGYYNIASTLAQVPVILGSPLVLFIFPYFSKYASEVKPDQEKVDICFEKISYLLNIIVLSASILMFLYAKDLLILWTGKTIQADMLLTVVMVIRVLLIGTLFLALQFPLFYLLLSKGKTKYTIYQGIIQIGLGLPLLYLCASRYGLRGIGFPWILVNLGSLIFLTFVVFKSYTQLNYFKFFLNTILIPAVISLITCSVIYVVYLRTNLPFYFFIVLSGLMAIIICNAYKNVKVGSNIFNLKELYNFPTN